MIRLSDVYIRNVYKTVIEHVWYFLLVLFSCQRETRTGISGFSDSGAGWIWLIFPVPNSIFCLEERYRTLPIFCNWKFFLCFSYQREKGTGGYAGWTVWGTAVTDAPVPFIHGQFWVSEAYPGSCVSVPAVRKTGRTVPAENRQGAVLFTRPENLRHGSRKTEWYPAPEDKRILKFL